MVNPPPLTRLRVITLDVHRELRTIDAATASFAERTRLHCPDGCGLCCENPKVEATALEMLPAARELVSQGRADAVLDDPRIQSGTGICSFYEQGDGPGRGRCGMYDQRPAICRLFGFAAARTKRGPELAQCHVHYTHDPETTGRAFDAVRDGEPVPMFDATFRRVAGIAPDLAHEQMPLNRALRIALEKVLLDDAVAEHADGA